MGQELAGVLYPHHLTTTVKLVSIPILWGEQALRRQISKSSEVNQLLSGQCLVFSLSSPCDWEGQGQWFRWRRNCRGFSLPACGHVWFTLSARHLLGVNAAPFPQLYLVQAFVSLYWYSPDFGTWRFRLQSRIYLLLGVWPLASCLPLSYLHFLICNLEIMPSVLGSGITRMKWRKYL